MLRPKLFIPLYNGARAALVAGSHGAQTGVPPYTTAGPHEPDLGSALPNSHKTHAHHRDAGSAQPDGHPHPSNHYHQDPASDYGAASATFPDAPGPEGGYPGLDSQGAVQSAWQQQSHALPAGQQPRVEEEQRGPKGASGASFPAPLPGPTGPDAAPHLAFASPLRAILQPGLPAAASGVPPAHLVARSLYPPHVFPQPFPSKAPSHAPSPLDRSLPRADCTLPEVPLGQIPSVSSNVILGHTEGLSPWRTGQVEYESSQQSLDPQGAATVGHREPGVHHPIFAAEQIAPSRKASGNAGATEQVNESFRGHLHERPAYAGPHNWPVPPPLAPLPMPIHGPQHGSWGTHMGPGTAGRTEVFQRQVAAGAGGVSPWTTSPLLAPSRGPASLPKSAAAGVRAYHHLPGAVSRPPLRGAPMVHRAPEILPLAPPQLSKGSLRQELVKLTRNLPGAPEAHGMPVARPGSPCVGPQPELPELPLTLAAASFRISDVLAQDVGSLPLPRSPGASALPAREAEASGAHAGQALAGRQGAIAEAEAAPAETGVPEGVLKPHKPRHRGKRGGRSKHTRGPRPTPVSSEQASPLVLPLSGSPGATVATGAPTGDATGAPLRQQRKGFHGHARGGPEPGERRRARSAPVRVSSMQVCQVLESCVQRLHTLPAQADASLAQLSPEECAALLQKEWERAWGPRYATSTAVPNTGANLLSDLPVDGHTTGGPGSPAPADPGSSKRWGPRREVLWQVPLPLHAWHVTEALKVVETPNMAQGLVQWSEKQQRVQADAFMYAHYIGTLARLGKVEAVEEVHEMVRRGEVPTSIWTYTRLINGYRILNRGDKALEVFEEVKASDVPLDSSVFSSVMTLHNRAGRYTKTVETFEEMAAHGVKPDDIAFGLLLAAHGRLGDKYSARRVHQQLSQQEMRPSTIVMNALMHAHCKTGDYNESMRVFQQMKEEGPPPDETTFSIAIDLASKKGAPWEAEALFEEMEARKLRVDSVVWGTMLQMFGRYGDLKKVKLWLRRMLRSGCQPTVATFNSLLFPLVNLGLFEEADLLLDWMVRQGHTPSLMTYSLFLSHCTHARSRDEAHTLLRLMAKTRSEGHEIISLLLAPPGSAQPDTDTPPLPESLPFSGSDPVTPDHLVPLSLGGDEIWGVNLSSLGAEEDSGPVELSRGSSSSRSSSSEAVGAREGSSDSASVTSKGDPDEGGLVWGGGALSEEAKWARIAQILDKHIKIPGRRWVDMLEERRCFADASLDFLAKFGLHGSAARLWEMFLARNLYDGAAKVRPQDWKGGNCEVDFHVMSRGTAQIVLKWAMRELRRSYETEGVCPDQLLLITGWGKRSREHGVPLVRQGIEQCLLSCGIPFSDGIGVFAMTKAELEEWFDNPAYAGLPDLHDDWTS